MTRPKPLSSWAACSLLIVTAVVADSPESQPPAPAIMEGSVTLPLDLSTGRPIIDITIGGHGPYTMILDTGAAATLIDGSLAAELGLEFEATEALNSPMQGGAPITAHRVTLPDVTLADTRFEAVPALTWDNGLGLTGIRGVLAFAVFRHLTATIDFPAATLTLTGTGLAPELRDASVPTASPEFHIVEADITIGEQRVRGHIDTGSPGGISIPTSLADQLTFSSPPVVVGQGRTVDSTFTVRSADYPGSVTIAGYEVVGPTLTIIDTLPAVNVGTSALMNTRLHVDGPAQRLAIEVVEGAITGTAPQDGERVTAIRQAAPGASAPFGVRASPGSDAIQVGQVVAGSRAEKSGLLAGDRITAIDGTPISEIASTEIPARLGRVGAMLTVHRGSDSVTVTVQ